MTTANDFLGGNVDQIVSDPIIVDNPLEALVGDGRKFKSVEDLARGKLESDNFIKQLQEENRLLREASTALREDKNTRDRLEELVRKLSTPTPSTEQNPMFREQGNPPSGLTEEDLKKFYLEQKRQEAEEANLRKVQSELEQHLGSNWQTIVRQKANTLGLSVDEVYELSKKHPNLLIETMVARAPQENAPSVPNPLLNTAALHNKNQTGKNWAYYEKLRLENPKLYHSASVQKELLAYVAANGTQ